VVLIVSKAQPTELVGALSASHVHAALVLLDICLALRTGLSINFKPIGGIGFLVASNPVIPSHKQFAVNRCVRLLKTTKAPLLAAVALYINCFFFISLNNIFALLAWTPFSSLGEIHERFILELQKFIEHLLVQKLPEYVFRNYVFALLIRALCKQDIDSLLSFYLTIAFKAIEAELMTAVRHSDYIMKFVLAVTRFALKKAQFLLVPIRVCQIELKYFRDKVEFA
jgi:hypothetical protein